jgi:hypothetical protein
MISVLRFGACYRNGISAASDTKTVAQSPVSFRHLAMPYKGYNAANDNNRYCDNYNRFAVSDFSHCKIPL